MAGEYRLEEDKKQKLLQALQYKFKEHGLDGDPADFIEMLTEYWYVMIDETAVDSYVTAMEDLMVATRIAELEQELANLQA